MTGPSRSVLAALLLASGPAAAQTSYGTEDLSGIEINRIGDYSHEIREYQDTSIVNALGRLAAAGVPKAAVRQVTIEPDKGPGALKGSSGFGLATSYRLWLKLDNCPSNVFMTANFAGRITSVTDKAGCLAGKAAQ